MKKRISKEALERRFHIYWRNRRISDKPFLVDLTEEEQIQLLRLNHALAELEKSVTEKVVRLTKHMQSQIAQGNFDFDDFFIEGSIVVDGECYDAKLGRLMELSQPHDVITANATTDILRLASRDYWEPRPEYYYEQIMGKGQSDICSSFHHLCFSNEVFIMPDLMKLTAKSFVDTIKIYL